MDIATPSSHPVWNYAEYELELVNLQYCEISASCVTFEQLFKWVVDARRGLQVK